jgi:hypothetical protein
VTRPRRAAPAILLLALALAGCGGGGRLSHNAFVARVDALCKASVAEVKKVEKPTSAAGLPRYLADVRPIQSRFLERARKLRPPARDEPVWRQALAFDRRVLHQYDLMGAAARRGDEKAVARIGRGLAALPERNPYERRLGMKGC